MGRMVLDVHFFSPWGFFQVLLAGLSYFQQAKSPRYGREWVHLLLPLFSLWQPYHCITIFEVLVPRHSSSLSRTVGAGTAGESQAFSRPTGVNLQGFVTRGALSAQLPEHCLY